MTELKTVGCRPKARLELSSMTTPVADLEYRGTLGEGVYGRVYAAQSTRGELAVKRNLSEAAGPDGATSLRELDCLVQMRDHPYIIQLTDVIPGEPFWNRPLSPIRRPTTNDDRRDDLIHFAFPRARSNLLTVIQAGKSRDHATIRRQLAQLLLALEYLHGHNLVHRDLKPENILIIGEDTVQICDFGMAKRLCPQRSVSPGRFTRFYRPPEHAGSYDGRADVWSLGCIAYEMITGSVLVEAPEDADLDAYTTAALRHWRQALRGQDPALLELLEGLLAPKAERRWTATRALEAKYFQPVAELIRTTRARYPIQARPVAQIGYRSEADSDFIIDVVERLQTFRDADLLLTPDVLFHALDLFDRSRYAGVSASSRFIVSLYMAAKYCVTDYQASFAELAAACGQETIDLKAIECILLAEWSGRICAHTMYELAAPTCSEDQLMDLLNYYLEATTITPGQQIPVRGGADLLQAFLQGK